MDDAGPGDTSRSGDSGIRLPLKAPPAQRLGDITVVVIALVAVCLPFGTTGWARFWAAIAAACLVTVAVLVIWGARHRYLVLDGDCIGWGNPFLGVHTRTDLRTVELSTLLRSRYESNIVLWSTEPAMGLVATFAARYLVQRPTRQLLNETERRTGRLHPFTVPVGLLDPHDHRTFLDFAEPYVGTLG